MLVDIAARLVKVSRQTFALAALGAVAAALPIALAAPVASASIRGVSWGHNAWGSLGNGAGTFHESYEVEPPAWLAAPICASGTVGQCPSGPYLNGVSAVSAGGSQALALMSDGTVTAWGENADGQLGDGTDTGPHECHYVGGPFGDERELESRPCSATPVAVSGLSGVVAVAAGANHSLALLSDGDVMAWGENADGQLGDGTRESSDVPVRVSDLSGVTAISAGGAHSLALLSGGTIMAWGADGEGQLGDGSYADSHVPVSVSGLSGATAVSAGGGGGSLALTSDGTVMAWGSNFIGLLGIGGEPGGAGPANSDVPVEVCAVGVYAGHLCPFGPFLTGVSAISAGYEHDMALLGTGAVASWGQGGHGQLGNSTAGMEAYSYWPVQAGALANVDGVSAGNEFSLAFGSASPAVTVVSPNEGVEVGGTLVSIAGADLTGATAVDFGSTPASSFTIFSPSSMTAVSPAGAATVDVTVTTPEGVSSTGPADRFTYVPALLPTVKRLKPKTGPSAGGTTVTITGANFAAPAVVRFGANEATSVTVSSADSITAVSPSGPSGTVDVTVTTAGGTSATSYRDYFKYKGIAVGGVSPSSGPTAGGSAVTVTGTGFATAANATTFEFGKLPATGVSCSSTTTCSMLAPASTKAQTVDVRAKVGKATSKKNPPEDQFTYD